MEPEMPKQKALVRCNQSWKSYFNIAQYTLRILVIAFTLAGAIIMITSKQSVTVFGIVMDARYTYSSAFRFKVAADFVVCGLALLSVVLVSAPLNLLSDSVPNKYYFYLFIHDLVCVVVLVSGCSAATAIAYVGEFGQDQVGWVAICDSVRKFCDLMLVSVASSFLAVICILLLLVMLAHKLVFRQNPNSKLTA